MSEHPTLDELVDYPLGRLSVERSRQVWQHCSACDTCGNELAAIIVMRSNAITDDTVEHAGSNWKYLAIAASVVLVLAVGWASVRFLARPSGDQTAASATASPPDGTAQSDYAALATRETLTQAHLDFRFGIAAPAATNQARVRNGVQAIVDGRYGEAERTLRDVMRSSPSEDIAVYLGIALYLQGDRSDEAVNLLRAADPAGGSLGRAGHWYLANLFVARGEINEARPILEDLGNTDDRWGRRAQDLLGRLEGF